MEAIVSPDHRWRMNGAAPAAEGALLVTPGASQLSASLVAALLAQAIWASGRLSAEVRYSASACASSRRPWTLSFS